MVSYQHSPLLSSDLIRLVTIAPEKDHKESIRLSIRQARLKDAPKYEALSYEWGTEMCQQPVICDKKELSVTMNLEAALRRLRLADNPRWMWIDAICIDQTNLQERSQQVCMMRDIYARANRVLIWIGDELSYSKQVFETITKMAKMWLEREIPRLKSGDIKPRPQLGLSTAEESSLLVQNRLLWDSIFTLFSSTYFGRTWIIQEIAVSRRATVVRGTQQINWNLFHWSAAFIQETTSLLHASPDTDTYTTITSIAKFKSMSKQTNLDPLAFYLRFVQASKCTDPRDKVFGMLGLRDISEEMLPHKAKILLQVHYTKTVQQVYRDAVEYIIFSTQDLEICFGHPLTSKSISGLPSWVPDWSFRIKEAPAAFLIIHYRVRHTLPGKITFNNKYMYVNGLILDSIDFTTNTMSSETPLPDIKQIILHLCKYMDTDNKQPELKLLGLLPYLNESTYKDGQTVFEALWRTLIGNTADFEPARPDFVRHFWAVLDIMILHERGILFAHHNFAQQQKLAPHIQRKLQHDPVSQRFWKSAEEGESHLFFLELVNTIAGRVFLTTERGYMGFAARGAKIGDRVCILGGGWTPFILRERDSKGGWEMIGDSYLHGMMQGEILDTGGPKVQRFRIF